MTDAKKPNARRLIDGLAAEAGLAPEAEDFDAEAYQTALAECTELTDNLLKVMRKEMTPEEAQRRAVELFAQVAERYRELASRKR